MKSTLLFLLAVACASASNPPPAAAPEKASGIDLAGIDSTVAPGDDFFAYANGAWIKSAEIPPDRSVWGTGSILGELTAKRTAALIDEASKTAAPAGSDARKVGDYYASAMDEAGIEAKGLTPLKDEFDRIAAIAGPADLARYFGGQLRADVDVLNSTNLFTDDLLGLWV